MNEQQLSLTGYTNVTGLTCLSYGQESMRFRIPSVTDYPNQRHLSGKDFIFLLLENGQTWFKKVDLTVASRATVLYYLEGNRIVSMDSKNPENTQGTVFAYPFEFEAGVLNKRKLNPNCVIDKSTDVISSTEIMKIIFETITLSTYNFLNYLFTKDYTDLIQFPNETYLKVFGSTLVQKVPVTKDELRNLYILVVIQAQRDGKFPYNLNFSEFTSLVTIQKPVFRCKIAELVQ